MTVEIQIPTSSSGQSLAQVRFNGTDYENGTVLSGLISGYNYTFSVTHIAPSYAFSQWAVSSGGITGGITSTTTTIYFGCAAYPLCSAVNLSLGLAATDHSLTSGEAFDATVADSMTATFSVPSLSWHYPNSSQLNPRAGAYEVVDWGVGLGGVTNSPAIVAGLQLTFTATNRTGVYHTAPTPFWSTTIRNRTGQTNFSLSSEESVDPGDVLGVGIEPASAHCVGGIPPWWNCTSGATVEITDLTYHSGKNWMFSASPSLPSASTGQWMAWDPVNSSGHLSPNVQAGAFSNLSFNNLGAYPSGQGIHPCSPWPACIPSNPAGVEYEQWANAGAGWNESLDPGNPSYPGSTVSFQPSVSNLVNLRVDIFPNGVPQLGVAVNSVVYYYLANPNLLIDQRYNITMSGSIHNVSFAGWGTSAGSLANASQESTTLILTSPGALECLTEALNPWGAYVEQVAQGYNNHSKTATFPSSATGQFLVPNATFNHSSKLAGPQVAGIWVGLGGYGSPFLWQAGIQTAYSSGSSPVNITPWYEIANGSYTPPVVYGPAAYRLGIGDNVSISVSITGGRNCPSTKAACWSIVDYSRGSYFGQPHGTGNYENWSGSISSANYLPIFTADWAVESPAHVCVVGGGTSPCALPVLGSVTFFNLSENGTAVQMFGSFQAVRAYDDLPSGVVQKLTPSIVCTPGAKTFTVTED